MDGAADAKEVVDRGPLGLKGTLAEGLTFGAGKVGQAVLFSGKDQPLEIASSWTVDNLTRQFSVSVWVHPDQRPDGDIMFILSKRKGWWSGTPFAMGYDRDGRLSAVCNDGNDHWIHSDAPLKDGAWQHVVLTFEVDKQFAMYVDGVPQREQAQTGKLRGNTEALNLGYVKGGDFPGGNYQAYRGSIDELRVFPVRLTPAQVKQEFAGNLPTRPADKRDYPVRGMDDKDIPAEVKKAPDASAALTCSIEFDQTPVASGMWYDSPGGQLREVEVDGQKTWCLVAGQAMGMPWARSALFNLTDPRFRNGKSPAVDIELTYLDKAWAPVTLVIDAKGGSREVGGGWQSAKWNTTRMSVDDAFFGRRDFGNPDKSIRSDGYDLRVNGFNEDLYIRSIKIVGHDRLNDVDWTRMLRLRNIGGTSAVLVYPHAAGQKISYDFENLALKNAVLNWSWQLQDLAGKMVDSKKGNFTLAGEKTGSIDIAFNTDKLPFGPYQVQFDAIVEGSDSTAPLVHRVTKIGVITDTKLAKASPGEFLYGLCPQQSASGAAALAWCDVMGVDIVRSGDTNIDRDNIPVVDAWHKAGVQPMFMCDPPQDTAPGETSPGMDPAKRAEMLRDLNEKLETVARQLAGKVKYFELGNEPDLRFFYRGPISEYADSYKQMRAAVKRGNPDAVVMNGGLCFFGNEGDERARELLSLLSPGDTDAIAYHGHGPGVKAERDAFVRVRDEAVKHGLTEVPYVETESGVAADGNVPGELLMQARTAIEKMVFAQSTGSPAFFWFAAFIDGGDSAYTSTEEGGAAPRPVVLAYRTMVERLRHAKFERTIDLKVPDVETYVFQNAQTHQKVLVTWSNKPALHDATLRLDRPGVDIGKPVLCDMFGNASPARTQGTGRIVLPVGQDPTFLTWTSPGSTESITGEESMVAVHFDRPLFTGHDNQGTVTLRNDTDGPLNIAADIESFSRANVTSEPKSIDVKLAPGETKQVPVTLKLGQAEKPLRLPQWWRVFAKIDADAVDLKTLTSIPTELPGKGGAVAGVNALASGGRVNLSKVAGASVEKDAAVLMSTLHVDHDATLTVGASSDWWMQWAVNGVPVFDTLASGNGGDTSRLKYTFDLPLKAGDNTISVLVLSGSGGWSLQYGTSRELAIQQTGGTDPDRLVCTVKVDGKQTTEQIVPLDVRQGLPTLAALPALEDASALQAIEPAAVLDTTSVTNLFDKFPQAERWYKGADDLSGVVWLNQSGDSLAVTVTVHDDAHVDPAAGKLKDGDAVELAFVDAAGKDVVTKTVALVDGKSVDTGDAPAGTQVSAAAVSGGDLAYRLVVPRSLLGASTVAGVRVRVLDNDADYLKQFSELKGPGGMAVYWFAVEK